MSYTKEQIASALDYAVLSPLATVEDIQFGCAFANKHSLRSICVAPVNIRWAAKDFDNVSTVISYPHGNADPFTKYQEAMNAIEAGAKELDVVINYGRYLGGEQTIINQELHDLCLDAEGHEVVVKAILETCHFTTRQIYDACQRCVHEGVDYVKTSTGTFGGASVGAVTAMIDAVDGRCGVKASGGINSYGAARTFLDLGCTRLGSSRFLELVR